MADETAKYEAVVNSLGNIRQRQIAGLEETLDKMPQSPEKRTILAGVALLDVHRDDDDNYFFFLDENDYSFLQDRGIHDALTIYYFGSVSGFGN